MYVCWSFDPQYWKLQKRHKCFCEENSLNLQSLAIPWLPFWVYSNIEDCLIILYYATWGSTKVKIQVHNKNMQNTELKNRQQENMTEIYTEKQKAVKSQLN